MTQATRWFQHPFKTYTQKSCWRKKLSSTIHALTADHLLRNIGDWISGDPVINIIYIDLFNNAWYCLFYPELLSPCFFNASHWAIHIQSWNFSVHYIALKVHGQGVPIAWSLKQIWTQHILMIQCTNFHPCEAMWCCTMRGEFLFVWRELPKSWWCNRLTTHFSHWNTTSSQFGKRAFEQNLFIPGCSCTTWECVAQKNFFGLSWNCQGSRPKPNLMVTWLQGESGLVRVILFPSH